MKSLANSQKCVIFNYTYLCMYVNYKLYASIGTAEKSYVLSFYERNPKTFF